MGKTLKDFAIDETCESKSGLISVIFGLLELIKMESASVGIFIPGSCISCSERRAHQNGADCSPPCVCHEARRILARLEAEPG